MTGGNADAIPAEELAPLPKVDPEALALRAQPIGAIRFRRGVVLLLVASAIAGGAGTAWLALSPRAALTAQASDNGPVAGKVSDEAVRSLPRTYAMVPKLGPPLPGDLGRAILDRQRHIALLPDTRPMVAGGSPTPQRVGTDDIKAARESSLLVTISERSGITAAPAPTQDASSRPSPGIEASSISLVSDRDPNAQQRKIDFVRENGRNEDFNPHQITPARSPYILAAGSIIAASLITGLRSDLPGMVTAQVTEQAFDSATGRILLIPQGARLIGSYDSVVAFGQRRALVIWQRLLFPDGSSIRLDNMSAADPSGYAGLEDKVDFHTWSLLKGAALSTLLGVGAELQFSGRGDLVQALRQSTQQSVSRAGDQLTSRNLQVQPTISIRPGALVRLVVHQDLNLKPWAEQ